MQKNTNKKQVVSSKFLRYLLIFFGTLFLIIGVIGIVIPVLPTTPFLILTAACYARSSKKAHHWLLNNKWFGSYIKNYQDGKGVPIKVKITAISFLWITILASIIFIIDIVWIKVILIAIAIIVSIHIILLKTYKK